MEVRDLKIETPHGLHLRVAAKLVKRSRNFKSRVVISKGCSKADVNSILQLLLLDAQEGAEIRIVAEGEDEQGAAQAVLDVFIDGAGI